MAVLVVALAVSPAPCGVPREALGSWSCLLWGEDGSSLPGQGLTPQTQALVPTPAAQGLNMAQTVLGEACHEGVPGAPPRLAGTVALWQSPGPMFTPALLRPSGRGQRPEPQDLKMD